VRAERGASKKERTGRTALALFTALSLAGIVTLFSQGGARSRAARDGADHGWSALDPGTSDAGAIEKLLPAAIKSGASLPAKEQVAPAIPPERDGAGGKVLRLR
jgi:hypothetical protein